MLKSTNSPFLRYLGGKSKPQDRDEITKYFPESFKEYREPFVGGGGIFFTVDESTRRWINDLNRPLIAIYEALKARPTEFIRDCMAIAPMSYGEPVMTKDSGVTCPKRLWEKFNELLDDQDADPALRFLFINRCSLFGRVSLDPQRRSESAFTNPEGWSDGLFRGLAGAAKSLKNTTITCSDFEWLFDQPGEDVLIYADPPYMVQTLMPRASEIYEYGFRMNDHRRLKEAVARSRHKVVLSYDNHPAIRDLYRDQFIHETSWTYVGTKDKRIGRELVITNYPVVNLRNEVAELF